MLFRSSAIAALSLALACLAVTSADAHSGAPNAGKKSHDDHHHQKAVNAPRPTKVQIEKRIARVLKRSQTRKTNREIRKRDTRSALERRLTRILDGAAINDAMRAEFKTHAQRVAWLRRIQEVAAQKSDFDIVVSTDKALAHERARHQRWWRSHLRRMLKSAAGKNSPQTQPEHDEAAKH